MRVAVRAFSLVCLLLLPGVGLAEGANRDEPVKALLAAISAATERARPSIASILVSRSEDYRTAPWWGEPAYEEEPGRLGRFDADAALAKVPSDARNRARIEAAIRAHDLSDPRTVPESYGSGFVVGPGLILTNCHVIRNATKIYVRLPGHKRGSWADLHAADPRSDLAVLRLLDKMPDLKPLALGKGETVKVGQVLLCLVNAWSPASRLSQPHTSWGLVSKLQEKAPGKTSELERSQVTLHHYGTLIQTDARTQPGCSGGVLLDLDGGVVGLTTALVAIQGADGGGALAIPFDESTRRIVEVLVRGEEVEYGFLGVQLNDRRRIPGGGVEVVRVSPGSPAAKARLMMGDVIKAVDGHPVKEHDDLFLRVGMGLAGRTVTVEYARAGGRENGRTQVRLAKFYVPGSIIASVRPPARGGLRVDYSSLLVQRGPFFGWSRSLPEGVIIREVIPGSSADKAHLQPDKVITHVNGKAVASPAEYYHEMSKARGRAELTFLNSEGGRETVILDLQ
jgi:serine protease Do